MTLKANNTSVASRVLLAFMSDSSSGLGYLVLSQVTVIRIHYRILSRLVTRKHFRVSTRLPRKLRLTLTRENGVTTIKCTHNLLLFRPIV